MRRKTFDALVTAAGGALRSMLLNACGFWQIGQNMLWSAFIAFGAGALLALFAALGLVHLRRTAPEKGVLPRLGRATKVQTS